MPLLVRLVMASSFVCPELWGSLAQGQIVATGSMDSTAKLWDVERGQELCTLMGHTAEIVSLNFNTEGSQIITGSFDHTTKVEAV